MILREVGDGLVIGALRLETESRVIEVDTDVAAALSIAVHKGIPVFAAGKRFASNENLSDGLFEKEAPEVTVLPPAFRKTIRGLD